MLYRRLELGLAEHHDARGLDVHAGSRRLHLAEHHRACRSRLEGVHEPLARRRRHGSVYRPHAALAEHVGNHLQGVEEEREHQHLSAILCRLVGELHQALGLARLGRVGDAPRDAAGGHDLARQDALFVDLALRRAHRAPFLGLDQLGKLAQHVGLAAAVVDGGDLLAELQGGRQRGVLPGLAGDLRAQHADEHQHLVHAVLERRAGHHQHAVGPLHEAHCAARAVGGLVLDVVRLVDDQQAVAEALGQVELAQGLIRGHGHAARPEPLGEVASGAAAVDLHGHQVAVPCHLAAPVLEHSGRADDQEMRRARVPQRHHHGDGLDGFP